MNLETDKLAVQLPLGRGVALQWLQGNKELSGVCLTGHLSIGSPGDGELAFRNPHASRRPGRA